MNMSLSKKTAFALAVAALSLSLCCFAGCAEEEEESLSSADLAALAAGGTTAEQLIEQSIAAELEEAVAGAEYDQLANAIMNTSLSDLAQYGIDGVEFVQNYLAELDYDIGDITVNGDTATVEITLNYNSLAALAKQIGGDLLGFVASFDLEQLPLEEIARLLEPVLNMTLTSLNEVISQQMLLDFQLVNGEWQLTDESKLDVMNALLEG